jgi:cytoskeletal protein RodZ
MNIDRKTKGLAVLSLVLVAAIASGILLTTQATIAAATTTNLQSNLNTQLAVVTTTASDTTNSTDTVTGDASITVPFWGEGPMGFGRHGKGFGGMCGGFGPIEASDEYKTTVTTIVQSDTDVQKLFADGYNVTRIMPIVKTTIDAQGNVATKATNATVVLVKDTSGYAFVSVDLAQNKVTQIVIYTKTVIQK